MRMKLWQIREWMRVEWMRVRKGQNTVEYLLMLSVIVGVVLVIGSLLRPYFKDTLLPKIQAMITGAAEDMGK